MRFQDIQRDLCIRSGATPEDILKSALLQEKWAQTTSSLQKNFGSLTHSGASKLQDMDQVAIVVGGAERRGRSRTRNGSGHLGTDSFWVTVHQRPGEKV